MTDQPRLLAPISQLMLVAYWIVLFVSTHAPIRRFDVGSSIRHLDKFAHFVAFAGLACLLAWATRADRRRRWWYLVCFLLTSAYAVVDEFSQSLLSYRTTDVRDLAADLLGVAFGLTVFGLVCVLLRRYSISLWSSIGLASRAD